jgi:hypothetical protein
MSKKPAIDMHSLENLKWQCEELLVVCQSLINQILHMESNIKILTLEKKQTEIKESAESYNNRNRIS